MSPKRWGCRVLRQAARSEMLIYRGQPNGRTLPSGAAWNHSLSPNQRYLLPPLPLLPWRQRFDLRRGLAPSPAPMLPHGRELAFPRESCVLLQPHTTGNGKLYSFASSIASWNGSPRHADARQLYPVTHERKRAIPRRSTDANLSRRFTWPSCECSRAGRMYHIRLTLRGEFGVSDYLFRRCSPEARFRGASTYMGKQLGMKQ